MRLVPVACVTVAMLAAMALVTSKDAPAAGLCLESGHHASACPEGKGYTGNLLPTSASVTLLNAEKEAVEECKSNTLGLAVQLPQLVPVSNS